MAAGRHPARDLWGHDVAAATIGRASGRTGAFIAARHASLGPVRGNRLVDARSARRTGRTIQFATRVSLEFDERLRAIAERESLMLVEVLERALDAYEEHRQVGEP